jgi:ABC-2 type transport system permease protein
MTTTSLRLRPTALGDDWHRFWALTWTLAVTEWKLRFYGSVLGYLWTLIRPFALFSVIYFVFVEIAKVGADVKNFGIYLLFSLVIFGFFAETVSSCVDALVARENLLRKVRFPRLVLPASIVLHGLFNVGMTLSAAALIAVASGVYPTWSWLQLPLLIALIGILASGLGMLFSVLFVRYRDIRPIWDVGSQILFYGSPILYVATAVPQDYMRPYLANPIATVLTQMRHAIVDPTAATAWEAIGGVARLAIPLGVIFGMFALGWWAFNREAPKVAENL